MLGHQHGHLDGVLDACGADQAEDRHQLLLHQRVLGELGEVGGQRREQDLGAGIDAEPGAPGQLGGLLPEGRHVDRVAAAEREVGQRVHLSEVSRCAPIRWNSATSSSYTSSSTMQVCSAGQITEASNVLEIKMSTTAPREVGGPVQVDRRVAGPDAEPGLAGGVGQRDDLRARR